MTLRVEWRTHGSSSEENLLGERDPLPEAGECRFKDQPLRLQVRRGAA